jgi:lipid A 4'-phosphatase
MNRAGLFIVVCVAIVAGLVLGLFPSIDLSVARAFYELGETGDGPFARYIAPAVLILRKAGFWLEIFFIVLPVVAVAIKLIAPSSKMLIPGSAILFLAASLALGPGLLVNVGFKNHWGRPRPGHVEQFGGDQRFVAWWQPDGECRKNCSFVSGEASAAFWTLAPARTGAPGMACAGLWHSAHIRRRHFVLAHGDGRTFSVRYDFRRRLYVPDCLADLCGDLSLGPDAA